MTHDANPPEILKAAHVARVLVLATGGMVLTGLAVGLLVLTDPENPSVLLMIKQFDPDGEGNIFAWYNTALFLANGLLLLLTARLWRGQDRRVAQGMMILGVVFVLLSLDEMVSIHERLGRDISRIVIGEEIVFAWIIPGAAFVMLMALYLLSAFRRLPRHVLRQMILAGGIFLAGALGAEALGWAIISVAGGWNYGYLLMTWAEESLEIIGLSVFLLALLKAAAASERSVGFAD